ncbi:hypothetical protein DPMN_144259 [Dreissena polymorpha]|uniref:Uncharacterized protein n=1 Tax=Dreissena polymorpha TaxID=45954 RepID=A0A9D4GHZ0_DREPO|nr:hypothetical protein DPMN_144259 [Dreissena polymorpha]
MVQDHQSIMTAHESAAGIMGFWHLHCVGFFDYEHLDSRRTSSSQYLEILATPWCETLCL